MVSSKAQITFCFYTSQSLGGRFFCVLLTAFWKKLVRIVPAFVFVGPADILVFHSHRNIEYKNTRDSIFVDLNVRRKSENTMCTFSKLNLHLVYRWSLPHTKKSMFYSVFSFSFFWSSWGSSFEYFCHPLISAICERLLLFYSITFLWIQKKSRFSLLFEVLKHIRFSLFR